MPIETYNKTNFHKHTFCIFQEVDFELIKNLKLNFKSKSGSSYYFVENGVYRLSNHWSRVANCKWRLDKNLNKQISNSTRNKLGFAKWSDFYADNDYEKLYFLEANFDFKSVNYYHKQSENYSSDKIIRTSTETTKLIKQIRTLFEETTWAKYLNEENIDVLRKEIINRLINSNQSFQEIRREFL
ncbi:hypothetical protein [Flavobacterium sp.]|uniref:hypothetical protein n=1 Tax=Flavobacterium sp. TaxID=239 RepID=UPI003750DEFC